MALLSCSRVWPRLCRPVAVERLKKLVDLPERVAFIEVSWIHFMKAASRQPWLRCVSTNARLLPAPRELPFGCRETVQIEHL